MIHEIDEINISKRSNKLQSLLFSFIFAMLIPTIVYSTIINDIKVLTVLMLFAYILMYVIFIYYIRFVPRIGLIFTLILILVSLLNFIAIYFTNDIIDIQDIASMLAKYLSYFLFFLCLKNETLHSKDFMFFLKKFIILAIIACIYNLIANRSNFSQLVTINSSYEVNFKSFFGNRNQFGGFLFLSNIALVYYNYVSERLEKLFIPCSFIMININLLLTMSRSALLATGIFYFLLLLYFVSKLSLKANIIFLINVILLFFIMRSQVVVNIINKYFIRADVGDSGRFDIWQQGINIFLSNNIILGSGSNAAIQIAHYQGVKVNQFHNFFIETLLDGGLVNLSLMLLTILFVLFTTLKRMPSELKELKLIYTFSLISLTVLLTVESVNFFGLGLVDTLYGIFFIAIPMMLTNKSLNLENSSQVRNS
ncbi:O-antigen ligase family protein [Streptococcus pluranimalium]|uniref:O-antigen ligase family protein n=1 Tax=Streptococcus pluranimalium TaxID=82348 RepID=UPI003F66AA28